MSDQPVYLFKAARRPTYRKENLHLLAEERGAILEFAWNRSWVSPDFFDHGAIARGRPVVFVFTDRPYTRFVPVRAGEVVSSEWDDLMLRLRVTLRNYVGLEDHVDIPQFTKQVKRAAGNDCPGGKFVAAKRDGVELVDYYDEQESDGWRIAVEELLAMSEESEDRPYRRSVFFRPAGLRVGDDELARARRVPLDPGAEATLVLEFHNPHLDEGAMADHALRLLAPDDALEVRTPDRVPARGMVELPVRALDDGQLTIQVQPASGHHTHVIERFWVRRDDAQGEEEPQPSVVAEAAADYGVIAADRRREELLAVYDFVCRNADFDPGDRIDLFERFATLLPGVQRIREEWALFCHRQGDDNAALRHLRRLDPERLETDDARFVLFRLLLDSDEEHPAHRVESLGLADEARFDRLLDELEALPSRVLARVVPELVEQLAEDQARAVLARVGDRIEDPGALVRTAQHLYLVTDDADAAYRWLRDRYLALRLADPDVEGTILELAGYRGREDEDPELGRIAGRHIINRVEVADADTAHDELLKVADALSPAERARLYQRVAHRLADRDASDRAAALMTDLAWRQLTDGDPTRATEAVTAARGFWASTGQAAPPASLLECTEAVERAWEDCEPLNDWLRSERDRRREELRKRYLNRRILIAGGRQNTEWIDHLHDLTGADIDWCTAFRDETDDLDAYAERIRNGHYALVVHYLHKTGHQTGDVLKPACDKTGVAWVNAPTPGRRGLEEAVWGVVRDVRR